MVKILKEDAGGVGFEPTTTSFLQALGGLRPILARLPALSIFF